jgi:hypothetical protein
MSNYIVNPENKDRVLKGYLSDELHFTFYPKKLRKYADVFFKLFNFTTDNSLYEYDPTD